MSLNWKTMIWIRNAIFITSNGSVVIRIRSGKGCILYPCTLNILEEVVSQIGINTEAWFGNIQKYILNLPQSNSSSCLKKTMKILRMCNAQIPVEHIVSYDKLVATPLLVKRGLLSRAILW